MRIAIVGAGIVGVTTAYELAALGHAVTVFERRGSVAAEASFAHAGVVAAPWTLPSAAARLPWPLLGQLLRGDAPLRLGGRDALARGSWLWRWWRASRAPAWRGHRIAMLRLAQFSRDRLLELTRSLNLDYDQMPGFVVLLRGARELAQAQPGLALLRELGVAHELVDAARCRRIEPGLSHVTALQAAIHLPHDGVGNCRHFAHLLKSEAQRLGAAFRFDAEVRTIAAGHPARLVAADGGRHDFDAIVVCAGVQAAALLAPVGIRLPLVPVHGYSITAPLRHVDGLPPPGPRAAVLDQRWQVTISRLGERLRVAGGAEIGGHPQTMAQPSLRLLYRVLDDWFPGAARTREAQHWKGAQPALPDGPPLLGESGAAGIWLNVGHGSSGWALACGSARVLAECISGRAAPVDLGGLTPARLR